MCVYNINNHHSNLFLLLCPNTSFVISIVLVTSNTILR